MLIANKECDYIIKNLEAVNALIDCHERAKSDAPRWLQSQIIRSLNLRLAELPTISNDWEITASSSPYEVCVTPNSFNDEDKEIGIHFGIEAMTYEELAAEDLEDGPWVYMYLTAPDTKSKKINEWKKNYKLATMSSKAKLNKKGYLTLPQSQPDYLVVKYMLDDINLSKLGQDPKLVIDAACNAIISLTQDAIDLYLPLP